MKVYFFYANWCPHCLNFINYKLNKFKETLKDNNINFVMIESNNVSEIKDLQNKYNINIEYYPTFYLEFKDKSNKNKVEEFSPDDIENIIEEHNQENMKDNDDKNINDDQDNEENINDNRYNKELRNNKQNNYKLILIYSNEDNQKVINNIYKQFEEIVKNTKYKITRVNINKLKNKNKYTTLTPFFVIVNVSESKSRIYSFNNEDLKKLYRIITKKEDENIFDKITGIFSQIFNDEFKTNLDDRQKVLKCSYYYDNKGTKTSNCTEI